MIVEKSTMNDQLMHAAIYSSCWDTRMYVHFIAIVSCKIAFKIARHSSRNANDARAHRKQRISDCRGLHFQWLLVLSFLLKCKRKRTTDDTWRIFRRDDVIQVQPNFAPNAVACALRHFLARLRGELKKVIGAAEKTCSKRRQPHGRRCSRRCYPIP